MRNIMSYMYLYVSICYWDDLFLDCVVVFDRLIHLYNHYLTFLDLQLNHFQSSLIWFFISTFGLSENGIYVI